MQYFFGIGKCFNPNPFIHAYARDSVSPVTAEEKIDNDVIRVTESKILGAFALIEEGLHDEAVTALREFILSARSRFSPIEIEFIKDMMLEAGLEIWLSINDGLVISVLSLANIPTSLEEKSSYGTIYHAAANNCCGAHLVPFYSDPMVSTLEEAVKEKKHLKCAPYFLSKAFENGMPNVPKNPAKAQKYLQIATERGYQPGRLDPMRRATETAKKVDQVLQEEHKKDESLFSHLPNDVITYISSLQREMILAEASSRQFQFKK